MEFVLLHEVAHVLINDFDIPIIGPEENAADYIATIVLMRPDDINSARAERVRSFVAAVANGFATDWDVRRPLINELPFWDSHALTMQRFYQIGCLLYGSSPSTFPNLPSRIGMPKARADQCTAEYARARKSVEWLIETYGRSDNEAGAEITIDYQPPPTQVSQRALKSMREARLIENTVARITAQFAVPAALTIVTRRCGIPQATWQTESRTLTLCYELFDHYYLLARNPKSRARDKLFGEDVPR